MISCGLINERGLEPFPRYGWAYSRGRGEGPEGSLVSAMPAGTAAVLLGTTLSVSPALVLKPFWVARSAWLTGLGLRSTRCTNWEGFFFLFFFSELFSNT